MSSNFKALAQAGALFPAASQGGRCTGWCNSFGNVPRLFQQCAAWRPADSSGARAGPAGLFPDWAPQGRWRRERLFEQSVAAGAEAREGLPRIGEGRRISGPESAGVPVVCFLLSDSLTLLPRGLEGSWNFFLQILPSPRIPVPQPRIAMFCSSRELAERFARLASSRGMACPAHVAPLEDAVPLAGELASRGLCDVAVACRGTADLLSRGLGIPVLPVPPASLGLVAALMELAPGHRDLFVPLYAGEQFDFSFFEARTGSRVHTAEYRCRADLERIVAESAGRGFGPVVGGGLACALAARSHADFRFVMPGLPELSLALDAAGALAESMARRRSAMAGFSALLATSRWPAAVLPAGSPASPAECAAAPAVPAGQAEPAEPGAPGARGQGGQAFPPSQPRDASRLEAQWSFDDYLYCSDATAALIERLRRYARSSSAVLITGERGTGKAMLAQGLHRASARAAMPFVRIDCQGAPARQLGRLAAGPAGRKSLFGEAGGGTVFLDQVDALPKDAQAAVLRALQEQEARTVPAGSAGPAARIVASAARPLAEAVREGRLLEGLFYRLNALAVRVPPLRERPEDIPLLAEAFCEAFSRKAGLPPLDLPKACLDRLCAHPWPENVRQLRRFAGALVQRCQGRFAPEAFDELFAGLETASGEVLRHPLPAVPSGSRGRPKRIEIQPPAARPQGTLAPAVQAEPSAAFGRRAGQAFAVSAITPVQIDDALRRAGGRKKDAAQLLGISRTSLWRLLRSQARVQEA